MALAFEDVAVDDEAFEADRAARVDFVGADADFRAFAEPEAVGKTRGTVVEHAGRVHARYECRRRGFAFCHDAFRVSAAVGVDVVHGFVEVVHHAHREREIKVFFFPVFFRGGFHARAGRGFS